MTNTKSAPTNSECAFLFTGILKHIAAQGLPPAILMLCGVYGDARRAALIC